jgi:hypothetical protein
MTNLEAAVAVSWLMLEEAVKQRDLSRTRICLTAFDFLERDPEGFASRARVVLDEFMPHLIDEIEH